MDVFAIDFQEELSAFSTQLLAKQTEFTNDCIRHILHLYQTAAGQKSLVHILYLFHENNIA